MVDFVVGLAAAGNALKILKELNQIDRDLDKATLKLKIAELTSALASAQMTLVEAQTEAQEKDKEISKPAANFKAKADLIEVRGYHYRKRPDGKPQGRPYCPRCIQEGHLMMTVSTNEAGRPVTCPECQRKFHGASEYAFEDGGF